MPTFYQVRGVPVHSVLLMPTREAARNYARGDIELGFCESCGFISNLAFDPTVHEYSSRYEETQAFSPTFDRFHHRLAKRLIDRYDLRGKSIIEIGCGKGEFLTLLCELGGNHGIGFDPSYVHGRIGSQAADRVTFVSDFYSEKYAEYQADFICCKMTLEHIFKTAEFVHMVRSAIGDRSDVVVFFQVPEVARILRELAFWDIYYEHCSYFSLGSLARLFRRSGFEVIALEKDYDDQYLMIGARPSNGARAGSLAGEDDREELARYVSFFSENVWTKLSAWRQAVREMRVKEQRAILWGGSSKAVAFLTSLNVVDEIPYVVDINPYKHGTYVAGTGQEIVASDFLREYRPDVVIVMNPIYLDEVRQNLDAMALRPALMAV